jgi:hypothetical protein
MLPLTECIYMYVTIHPQLFFNEHKQYLIVSYLCDRHTIVTVAFLFPVFIVICLLFLLRLPMCTQPSVFPLFPYIDAIPLERFLRQLHLKET